MSAARRAAIVLGNVHVIELAGSEQRVDRVDRILLFDVAQNRGTNCRARRRSSHPNEAGSPDNAALIAPETPVGAVHVPILSYRTIDEAVRRANSLDVGLGGSVWGSNADPAAHYASQLECGTAWINQHGALHPMAPFGGIKCSGIGTEFNVDGLKEYTTVQVIDVAR